MSHAIVTFRDGALGKVLVVEATGRGFVLVPWSCWRQHSRLVARFALRIAEDRQLAALGVLAERLAEEYDKVGRWRAWRRCWRRPRNLCTETVMTFITLCGLRHDTSVDDPDRLFELLSASRHAVRLL